MNTHIKYQTVAHHHFDWMFDNNGTLEYPQSALMLVQAGDGRWFLEQEFGEAYGQFPGVVKSGNDLETEPTFYPDVETAARAAFSLMKQVHPSYTEDSLIDFLADE